MSPDAPGGNPRVTGRSSPRRLAGWLVVLLFAWLMGKWVYRHTNEQNCRDRGGAWEVGADSCAHPVKARAK